MLIKCLWLNQVKKEIHWCGLPNEGADSKAEWARQEKVKLREKLEQHHGFVQVSAVSVRCSSFPREPLHNLPLQTLPSCAAPIVVRFAGATCNVDNKGTGRGAILIAA